MGKVTDEFRFPSAPTILRGLMGVDIFLQSCDLLRTCSGFSLKQYLRVKKKGAWLNRYPTYLNKCI